MNLIQAIKNVWAGTPALVKAVPGGLNTDTGRARPAFPFAVIHQAGHPIGDWSSGRSYTQTPLVQISIFAESEDAANAAGELVKAVFDATQPPMDGSSTVLMMLPQQDLIVTLDPSGATGPNALPVWRAIITYMCWVQRQL